MAVPEGNIGKVILVKIAAWFTSAKVEMSKKPPGMISNPLRELLRGELETSKAEGHSEIDEALTSSAYISKEGGQKEDSSVGEEDE